MNKHLQNGVIKSEPKLWSKEECDTLIELKKQGLTFGAIAVKMNRTESSCDRKFYKMMKKLDTYNDKHRIKKYNYNKSFLQMVESKTLLDAYSGGVSWWKTNTSLVVVDNDIAVDGADYKLDAFEFLYKHRKSKFDIVDLDPFGSAFDCFDFALQIAQKGIIVTYGEIVGRRFNRQDYVEHRYGINTIDDFTTSKLSEYIEKRGLLYRKILTPVIKAEMTNISRVYYKIEHFDYGNSGCKFFEKKPSIDLFSSTE